MLCMPMFLFSFFLFFFLDSFCGLYCPNVFVFLACWGGNGRVGGGGASGAVNIHYFVWNLFSTIYKFSFIHSIDINKLGIISV